MHLINKHYLIENGVRVMPPLEPNFQYRILYHHRNYGIIPNAKTVLMALPPLMLEKGPRSNSRKNSNIAIFAIFIISQTQNVLQFLNTIKTQVRDQQSSTIT